MGRSFLLPWEQGIGLEKLEGLHPFQGSSQCPEPQTFSMLSFPCTTYNLCTFLLLLLMGPALKGASEEKVENSCPVAWGFWRPMPGGQMNPGCVRGSRTQVSAQTIRYWGGVERNEHFLNVFWLPVWMDM